MFKESDFKTIKERCRSILVMIAYADRIISEHEKADLYHDIDGDISAMQESLTGLSSKIDWDSTL